MSNSQDVYAELLVKLAWRAQASEGWVKTVARIPGSKWKTFDKQSEETLRQWAAVDFVPGEAGRKSWLAQRFDCCDELFGPFILRPRFDQARL